MYLIIRLDFIVTSRVCVVEDGFDLLSENFGRIFKSIKSVFECRNYSFLNPVAERLNFFSLLRIDLLNLIDGELEHFKLALFFNFLIKIDFLDVLEDQLEP